MVSLFLWLHTSRVTGQREMTESRLTEDEARSSLLDPEAVSDSRIDVQPAVKSGLGGTSPPTDSAGPYEPCRR